MSTELAKPNVTELLAKQNEILAQTCKPTYLPRVQLFANGAKAVKQKEIPDGHYGLVMDGQIQDLGEEVEAFFFAVRGRAQTLIDGETAIVFDINHAMYKEIAARADKNRDDWAGPECLIWFPEHECFATIYFGVSKTTRRLARSFLGGVMGKPAILGTKVTQGKYWDDELKKKVDGTWTAPTLAVTDEFECMPPDQELAQQVQTFLTAENVIPDLAEDGEDEDR